MVTEVEGVVLKRDCGQREDDQDSGITPSPSVSQGALMGPAPGNRPFCASCPSVPVTQGEVPS